VPSLVVTVIGVDRAGIVNELSAVAAKFDADWLESHLANLAGQFAGIVRLNVSQNNLDGLTSAITQLESSGLQIVVANPNAAESDANTAPHKDVVQIEITGLDRSGIVRDISSVLSNSNVSIDEFESETFNAAISGEVMFKASAKLILPDNLSSDDLSDRLHDIAGDVMIDMITERA